MKIHCLYFCLHSPPKAFRHVLQQDVLQWSGRYLNRRAHVSGICPRDRSGRRCARGAQREFPYAIDLQVENVDTAGTLPASFIPAIPIAELLTRLAGIKRDALYSLSLYVVDVYACVCYPCFVIASIGRQNNLEIGENRKGIGVWICACF